tara:strand:+ start:250 stop:807 length:558 start_codon:yes stop_codon:yes gene_type:complete
MAVKSVYNKYFQKSKVFLYPLLGIKRGAKAIPSETYIAWNGKIKAEDMKLVCLYHPDNSENYLLHESNVLLKHNRLIDVQIIDETNKVFVFDFCDIKDDWIKFINGKYSKISKETKSKILSFFDQYSANHVYMKSYLMPNKYFEDYAECLGVEVEFLKDVGELCPKIDMEKETFTRNAVEKQIIN